MAQEKQLGIGLIGAGAIMRLSHIPTVMKSGIAKLVGIYDPSRERADALAESSGSRSFETLDALLDSREIDAVIIATPNNRHEEAAVAAAKAGKHILCEKPLAIDIQSATRIVKAAEEAHVVLQVGFNQRFWSQVQIAKQLIDSGFIGDVHAFRSVYSEKASAYPAASRYRYDLAQSGGATIIDLTIHRIDLARHLVGDMTGVFAELSHHVLPEKVDDNVWLLTRFANGARGGLSSDRYSPAIGDGTDLYGTEGSIHIASETLNPFHAAPLAVYTERKAADLPDVLRDAHYPDAWWNTFEGGWIKIFPPRKSPYAGQFAEFCRCIQEGAVPLASGIDGLRAQEVVQGAYISKNEGRWVDLPLPADAPFNLPSY
ncbi:Gfo/Idh/MocA family protein [Paraburkholderia metrosideri]|uniref:Myo-inositol 2-dehydrogenase n=1 Tax=Paraburkholderia metrosideri TaxID=580937 RepID=A0ABN7IAW4_9BURK|nr:Gfo/Idh/MocA family oxidoreductase [Paraburkholderia metrosideri]CAD6554155.1 Myo-inositol 2-dehydrogenase [Paraburkholderia metrosideri]